MSVSRLLARNEALLSFLGGLLLAVPLSLVAGAAAALVVSLVAMLVSIVMTHDLYQAFLAPSYGVAAAAQCGFWLAGATVLWQVGAFWIPVMRLTGTRLLLFAALTGAGCAALALTLQQVLALLPPLRLQHTSVLWSDMPGFIVMLLSGACGGIAASGSIQFTEQHPLVQRLALYAAVTALLAEGTIALRSAFGLA